MVTPWYARCREMICTALARFLRAASYRASASATSTAARGYFDAPYYINQFSWSMPVTNKLLLEAGIGTTYYQWGGRQLDPDPTANLVQVVNLTQLIAPGVTTAPSALPLGLIGGFVRYRNWRFFIDRKSVV